VAGYARKKLAEADFRKDLDQALRGKPNAPRPRPIGELPEAALALFATGALQILDDYLASPPVKREGVELVATFEMPSVGGLYVGGAAVAAGLLLPAVQKVREAAARVSDSNNLKQIGLAMHNYHDVHQRLPEPGTADPKPDGPKGGGLSWRVHILPYLEQENLYRQFKLDEPWDSEHNKKLIDQMPKVYATPLAAAPPGTTYYKALVGEGALFERGRAARLAEVTDGLSNTLMVVEGGEPVVWTRPDDVEFTGNIMPMSLALRGNPRINVLFADGSVRNIDLSRVNPQSFKAAITRSGGEILPPDWDQGGEAAVPVPPVPKGKGGKGGKGGGAIKGPQAQGVAPPPREARPPADGE
jgi:prepilin-type processing-associated H-X9-DG protein